MWQCSISYLGFVGPKSQRKIYNVALLARGGRRCCRVTDDAGSMVSYALGRRRDSVTGPGMAWDRHHHGEDDVVGSWRMMALRAQARCRVHGITCSGTVRGAQCHGLRDDDGVTGMTTSPVQVRLQPWL
jgi:hypothetical protein